MAGFPCWSQDRRPPDTAWRRALRRLQLIVPFLALFIMRMMPRLDAYAARRWRRSSHSATSASMNLRFFLIRTTGIPLRAAYAQIVFLLTRSLAARSAAVSNCGTLVSGVRNRKNRRFIEVVATLGEEARSWPPPVVISNPPRAESCHQE